MSVAVVGTGLIGGSLAAALGRAGERVIGCDARPAAAARALELGLVERVLPLSELRHADIELAVVAVPVRASLGLFAELEAALPAGAIITDVGSVKGPVLAAAAQLRRPERFVGGHPLSGTERSGPDAADAALFSGRTCILTPSAHTDGDALAEVRALWQRVGARVVELDAQAHDRAMAFVSHLPHAVAFSLAAAVAEEPTSAGLSGGGFVDSTRIAASDPEMWRDVFLTNRDPLLAALDRFADTLAGLRAAIAAGDADALVAAVERARAGRRRVLGG